MLKTWLVLVPEKSVCGYNEGAAWISVRERIPGAFLMHPKPLTPYKAIKCTYLAYRHRYFLDKLFKTDDEEMSLIMVYRELRRHAKLGLVDAMNVVRIYLVLIRA